MALQQFDREAFSAPTAEINMTPLVDVMLVLLVIFLVTAPMLTQAVKLELPNETATEVADENPITLSVNQEGKFFWEKEMLSLSALEKRLQMEAQQSTKRPIHLRADENTQYKNVSRILALAQKYGLNNIGFITESR